LRGTVDATVPLVFGLTIEFGHKTWQRGFAVAVETNGTVQMSGEPSPGFPVRITAVDKSLRIDSDGEFSGEWPTTAMRIKALNEGFAIRAGGREFVLRVDDEVGVAEELGIAAATPRLARKMAARHNPEARPLPPEPVPIKSNLGAVAFALAGALVLVGGTFLQTAEAPATDLGGFSIVFIGGGILMVAGAYLMTRGPRWGRALGLAVLLGVIVSFGILVSGAGGDTRYLTPYVFISAGLVVGLAIMFSESLGASDD